MVSLCLSDETRRLVLSYKTHEVVENSVLFYRGRFSQVENGIDHSLPEGRIEELLYYYPILVKPWKPQTLIIGGFLNDYYSHYSIADIIFLLNRVIAYAKTDFPNITIQIEEMPSDPQYEDQAYEWSRFKKFRKELNDELQTLCAKYDYLTFMPCDESAAAGGIEYV